MLVLACWRHTRYLTSNKLTTKKLSEIQLKLRVMINWQEGRFLAGSKWIRVASKLYGVNDTLIIFVFVLYFTVLYCFVLYCIVLFCIALYCIELYCIALYCFVLYCIVFYCFVLWFFCISFIFLLRICVQTCMRVVYEEV